MWSELRMDGQWPRELRPELEQCCSGKASLADLVGPRERLGSQLSFPAWLPQPPTPQASEREARRAREAGPRRLGVVLPETRGREPRERVTGGPGGGEKNTRDRDEW